jgi:hypothetical protein
MQVANDYDKEVFNGDLGRVRAVDAEAGELLVDFDGRGIAYAAVTLDWCEGCRCADFPLAGSSSPPLSCKRLRSLSCGGRPKVRGSGKIKKTLLFFQTTLLTTS